MNAQSLVADLSNYQTVLSYLAAELPAFELSSEIATIAELKAFASDNENCFDRENLAGHMTASALIYDPAAAKVLLMHHKKLDKWLQMGGHADGETNSSITAMAEAQEESGLTGLSFADWLPAQCADLAVPGRPLFFDIDIHAIPEFNGIPAHRHYDVRFLLYGSASSPLQRNEEANNLRWFSFSEARRLTAENSLERMFLKVEELSHHQLLTGRE